MTRLVLLLVVLLAACIQLPQVPPSGLPADIGAPAVPRPGDTWVYIGHDGYTDLPKGEYTFQVSAVDVAGITVEATHEGRAHTERYTPDWAWVERPLTNLQLFHYNPPLVALPFPLHAGKAWRSYVMATDPASGRTNRVRIDGKVEGWQRLRVPAGEFDTLKVVRHVYAGNFDYFRTEDNIVETDWYAPRISAVVRHEGLSSYIDTSKGCRVADCNIIRQDWTGLELSAYPQRKR
jgi:hypothetical protein